MATFAIRPDYVEFALGNQPFEHTMEDCAHRPLVLPPSAVGIWASERLAKRTRRRKGEDD